MPTPTPEELTPWCELTYGASGGPGGQHANKVSTRAMLRFDFRGCTLLDDVQRERIAQRLDSRLSADGRVQVVADRERSQSANREAALARLADLLTRALHVDKPRTPTRPSKGSQRRRLHAKRLRGERKQMRRSSSGE